MATIAIAIILSIVKRNGGAFPEERTGNWLSAVAWVSVLAYAGISFVRKHVVKHT